MEVRPYAARRGANMKRIFLTGASGNMGSEALKCILAAHPDAKVTILVLPNEKTHPNIRRWLQHPNVKIVWGDLTKYEDVLTGVESASIVLHVGGMVSPLADRLPELTRKVNVGGAENVVRAIKAQPEPDAVKLVYIGTVAQTGSRMPPVHWGRTGDPVKISWFDNYAVTKTQAEAIIAESGLRQWVSLRQTGMAHIHMWKIFDPFMFHNPINGVFEWSTAKDSGRLMANLCADTVPDELWRGFYNIGGGDSRRVINHEFMTKTFKAMGIKEFRKVLKPRWFATRNFHGQWYNDSDKLNALVPYRSQSIDDYISELAKAVPWYVKAVGALKPSMISKRIEALSHASGGSMHWIETIDKAHIDAYFGSIDAWHSIPESWDRFEFANPSTTPTELDHGYDESIPPEDWSLPALREAARFRGGACLSIEMTSAYAPMHWQCALGHDFLMSPNLMLKGGHWCPTCMIDPASYLAVARKSPFFNQVFDA